MEIRQEENCSNRLIRVAITGPESTGKSSIANQLAEYFHTVFVPEFAREYIDNLNMPYIYSDILEIAKGQLKLETELYPKANKIIFCDTEFIVTKIWSENAFKKCDRWILKNIEEHQYDLYLLMNTDVEWEYDPQRQHPHLREYFFNLYKQELNTRNLPYKIISGLKEERLKNAIKAVNDLFKC
jgi:NadR type nicotinamide-nucleotide adenylyltransferase